MRLEGEEPDDTPAIMFGIAAVVVTIALVILCAWAGCLTKPMPPAAAPVAVPPVAAPDSLPDSLWYTNTDSVAFAP